MSCSHNITSNTTCPSGTSLELSHFPQGTCTVDNYTQVLSFGIGFFVTHTLFLFCFVIVFFLKKCRNCRDNSLNFLLFLLWVIATIFLIVQSGLIFMFNLFPTLVKTIEVVAMIAIVIARVISNEEHFAEGNNTRCRDIPNGASLAAAICFAASIAILPCDEFIIWFFLGWLAVIQTFDAISAFAYVCGNYTPGRRNPYIGRAGMTVLSLLCIVTGMVLLVSDFTYAAMTMAEISKLFLTVSGYIFVIFPPTEKGGLSRGYTPVADYVKSKLKRKTRAAVQDSSQISDDEA